MNVTDIGEGKIMPSTGQARFKCSYTAIVMKPFKGEVVDGKVSNVNKMGFFAHVGPLQVFVSSHVSVYSNPSRLPPSMMSFLHRDISTFENVDLCWEIL